MTKPSNICGHEEVRRFLESYLLFRQMLAGNRYARKYLDREDQANTSHDDPFLKAEMLRVRQFIMTLPDCREKMFLYYRYLCGHSIEKCADILEMSRRTAFRVATRAICLAAEHFKGI